MATIQIASPDQIQKGEHHGTIILQPAVDPDLVRYFHKENCMTVLAQKESVIGSQVMVADVNIQGDASGNPPAISDRILVYMAVTSTTSTGDPKDVLTKPGDLLAASCRPFEKPTPRFVLQLIQ